MDENIDVIEKYKNKHDGSILEVFYDFEAENPREWDNCTKIFCFTDSYVLGDKHDLKAEQFDSFEAIQNYLIKEFNAVVIVPLTLYDHSGISLSIGEKRGWDTSPVGFMFVDKKNMIDGCFKSKADALHTIKSDLDTYNQYLSGTAYGYRIYKNVKCESCGNIEKEEVDSSWGFYGELKEVKENAGLDLKDWVEVI